MDEAARALLTLHAVDDPPASQRSQRRRTDNDVYINHVRYCAPAVSPTVVLDAQVAIAQWEVLPVGRLRDELEKRYPEWRGQPIATLLYRAVFAGHVPSDAQPVMWEY